MNEFEFPEDNGCFEQPLTHADTESVIEGGWGWGAMFGGALGWMLGRSERSVVNVPAFAPMEGDFTPDEKDFLSQLWRFERELRDARENKEWERLYLLAMLAAESFNEGWSEFVPGNSGYSPSPRFDHEIREIIKTFIRLCQEALALDFESLITPEKFGKIAECQVNLNYATMSLTVDGVPFPSEQQKSSTQSIS